MLFCVQESSVVNRNFNIDTVDRRIDNDKGRTHELSQCAVRCMRGVLECWMRQADHVEKFKQSQVARNSLHVKFHWETGEAITKDEEYEHLQVR